MSDSTTTTTTTNADGTTTVQKVEASVESWYDNESARFHDTLSSWGNHLVNVTKSSAFATAAYALYQFAKHLI